MQISDSIEVGIGLSFIFFLASLVLTSFHEMLETVLKARGKNLYNGVVEMLDDPRVVGSGEAAAKVLYGHPLLRSLMRGDINEPAFRPDNLPSYLPTRSVVEALMDHTLQGRLSALTAPTSTPVQLLPVQRLRLAAEGIQNDQLRGVMIHALDTANNDINSLRDSLERWFDSGMDRVSGWYKRRSQRIIFTLGLATALLLNVNTLTIANSLWSSQTLRQGLVQVVQESEKQCLADKTCLASAKPSAGVAELERSNVPIGWTPLATAAVLAPVQTRELLPWIGGLAQIVTGYLITAFAVTLGAPFWFDILNRLMVIRATVKPTQKSQPEAPQDPQARQDAATPVSVKIVETPAAAAAAIDGDIYANLPHAHERLFEDDFGEGVPGIRAPAGAAQ